MKVTGPTFFPILVAHVFRRFSANVGKLEDGPARGNRNRSRSQELGFLF